MSPIDTPMRMGGPSASPLSAIDPPYACGRLLVTGVPNFATEYDAGTESPGCTHDTDLDMYYAVCSGSGNVYKINPNTGAGSLYANLPSDITHGWNNRFRYFPKYKALLAYPSMMYFNGQVSDSGIYCIATQ